MKTKIIIVLLAIILIDHAEDWFFDHQEIGYSQNQIRAVDTLVIAANQECGVGDWLCVIDRNSRR